MPRACLRETRCSRHRSSLTNHNHRHQPISVFSISWVLFSIFNWEVVWRYIVFVPKTALEMLSKFWDYGSKKFKKKKASAPQSFHLKKPRSPAFCRFCLQAQIVEASMRGRFRLVLRFRSFSARQRDTTPRAFLQIGPRQPRLSPWSEPTVAPLVLPTSWWVRFSSTAGGVIRL